MDIDRKIKLSKGLISIAASISVGMAIYTEMIKPEYFNEENLNTIWMTTLGLTTSAVFVIGLYLGSRGVGLKLSLKRFLQLLFGFPCWIPFAIYFVAVFLFNSFN